MFGKILHPINKTGFTTKEKVREQDVLGNYIFTKIKKI